MDAQIRRGEEQGGTDLFGGILEHLRSIGILKGIHRIHVANDALGSRGVHANSIHQSHLACCHDALPREQRRIAATY